MLHVLYFSWVDKIFIMKIVQNATAICALQNLSHIRENISSSPVVILVDCHRIIADSQIGF